MTNYTGTPGDDNYPGTAGTDDFDMSQGGNDTVTGLGDVDAFHFGAALTAADHIDGGAGDDYLDIMGDYSAGLTLSSSTMTNVERFEMLGSFLGPPHFTYNITITDPLVASGQTLTLSTGGLLSGDTANIVYTSSTPANFILDATGRGTSSFDTAAAGKFTLTSQGPGTSGTTVKVYLHGGLDAGDQIDGTGNNLSLYLDGDYSAGVTFGATTLTGAQNVILAGGHSYNFTANAATSIGTLDASALGSGDTLTYNGAAVTGSAITVFGGAGTNIVSGGNGNDNFEMVHGGTDTLTGGDGNDSVVFTVFTASDSFDGGNGDDTASLESSSSGSMTLGPSNLQNVEHLLLGTGNWATDDALVAAGQTLQVAMGTNSTFDGSAETNGNFAITVSGFQAVTIAGGGGNDSIDLGGATGLDVSGGGGNDSIYATDLAASDQIDGGSGGDTLYMYTGGNGPYSIVFGATTVTGIESIGLGAARGSQGFSVTTDDATTASGTVLYVQASNASANTTFDDSPDTDGSLYYTGSVGNDVVTATGNSDLIDLSVTPDINHTGGADTVDAGAGNDQVYMGQGFSTGDTLDGGSGIDYLYLDGTGGYYAFHPIGSFDNFEFLVLADPNNNYYTFSNITNTPQGGIFYVDARALPSISHLEYDGTGYASQLAILSGAGDDVLTGSGNADSFYLDLGGNDTANGGNGRDVFYVTPASLTSGDTVNGGTDGASDVLWVLSSGSISAGALANVSHIEEITLGAASSIALTDALATSSDASGHLLVVNGSSGNDTVDASAVGAAGMLVIYAGAGGDTLTGGSGYDTFSFAASDLSSADTVNGGTGVLYDRLNVSTAGTVAAAAFANVSHVEAISLANGTNSITLDATMAASSDAHLLAIYGSSGNDTVDGSAVASGTNLYFYAGSGNDTLTGGADADFFSFAAADFSSADTVNGGTGAGVFDRLVFTTAGTIGAASFGGVSHIEQVILADGTNNVTISSALVAGSDYAGPFFVIGGSGADTIDAGGVTGSTGVEIWGAGGADVMTATNTSGYDIFLYRAVSESTSAGYDTIVGLDWNHDFIQTDMAPGSITAIDATVGSGALNSGATFDSDLGTAMAGLGAHHAGLFTPNSGSLAGQTFLVVDINGVAGYQSGSDLVIDIDSTTGTITAGHFI